MKHSKMLKLLDEVKIATKTEFEEAFENREVYSLIENETRQRLACILSYNLLKSIIYKALFCYK